LFAVPPTQTSIEQGQWVEHNPVATISESGPIEFSIDGSGDDYMDLANTLLYVKAKVVKGDGTRLAVDDPVGPINLWLHSLFSQVDMSLNEKLISPSTNTYPYRAYMETLLSYGPAAKKSQLTASLWYHDTPGHMDARLGDDNEGLAKRRGFIERSREVDMMGKLHMDLFFQDRHLLNGVKVKIRLVRHRDEFVLMAGGADPQFKVRIMDAKLFVRKVKLSAPVQMSHIKALETASAKYPIRRVEMKVFSVPRLNLSANQENLFLGPLPKKVIVGYVDSDAYNGSYAKNPFNFNHYNTNFLALYVDGHQVPAKPLQPHFRTSKYIRSYLSLFTGTGQLYQDEGNEVSRDDYGQGYTLFAFDLTPDLAEGGDHFNLIKQGNLRLEIQFAQPLPNTINVITYAEFENIIEIDKSRNVIFDYSA
jgi:hypothetical protein